MTTLREAAQQALEALEYHVEQTRPIWKTSEAIAALEAALAEPQRRLTDEVIAELWYKHGTFHHHFARAIERWVKGEQP